DDGVRHRALRLDLVRMRARQLDVNLEEERRRLDFLELERVAHGGAQSAARCGSAQLADRGEGAQHAAARRGSARPVACVAARSARPIARAAARSARPVARAAAWIARSGAAVAAWIAGPAARSAGPAASAG